MKTYKARTTATKGITETLAVAAAVYLSKYVAEIGEQREAFIVLFAAAVRMGFNILKHKFGFDISNLIGKK